MLEILIEFRDRLVKLKAYPWQDIKNWAVELEPRISATFPAEWKRIEELSRAPRLIRSRGAVARAGGGGQAERSRPKPPSYVEQDRKQAEEAKETLLRYLNGLIGRLEEENANKNDSRIISSESSMNPVQIKLVELKNELDATEAFPSKGLNAWVLRVAPFIRKHFPEHVQDFKQAAKIETTKGIYTTTSFLEGATIELEFRKRFASEAKSRVLSVLDGLILISQGELEQAQISTDSEEILTTILDLCRKFPEFAEQLKERRSDRIPLLIVDEYDVQYLFKALLSIHAPYVVAEETTPSFAGKSARMDFLIKPHGIVLELKMIRRGLGFDEVRSQLIVDIFEYERHPEVGTLICYVYDPDRKIKKASLLELELSKKVNGLDVVVMVSSTPR